MRLNIVYVIAESQMAAPLREAVVRLNQDPTIPFRFELDGFVAGAEGGSLTAERLGQALADADIFIGSMLNTDRDVRLLDAVLQRHRPPVTAVFTSQPELMVHTHIHPLDGRQLAASRAYAREVAAHVRDHGTPLPPIAHVLLAAAPRLEPHLGRKGLGDLWGYARAALYWLHGSVDNLMGMVLHLASHHPRAREISLRDVPPPRLYPEVALWHPDAPDLFTDAASYDAWYRSHWANRANQSDRPPRLGVVLFRQMITSGSHAHYATVIRALEAEGIQVVAGFGGLDNRALVQRLMAPGGIDLLLNLTGFNLVGSMGNPQPDAAVELLQRLDVPYLVSLPLLFQTPEAWQQDPMGLAPMQTALQVVLPELEGGIEPRVFSGKDESGRFQPFEPHVVRLVRRVRHWIRLRRLPPPERRVAIVIFSFPPDKGSVGSAAYLDVFHSLFALLQAMKREGYRVELPADVDALRAAMLSGSEGDVIPPPSPFESASAARIDRETYRRIVPYARKLRNQWGPPPGDVDTYRGDLAVKGRSFGNVFVGIQPSFGYEGDPMRLLLSPDASPSHSFAGFYGWLEQQWGAHAVLHLGTHGSLEFMPGKQVGLTADCYPDLLIGNVPHLYLYAVNNPSEATIAKRRGYATTVSYLTPPLASAGLYKDLAEIKRALAARREAESPATRRAAAATLRELIARSGLEEDLRARNVALPGEVLPEQADATDADATDDTAVDDAFHRLADYVHELETEQIPLGLHTAGQPLDEVQKARFLAAALAHPRPEEGVPSLDEMAAAANRSDPGPLSDAVRDDVITHLVRGDANRAWAALRGSQGDHSDDDPPAAWERLAAFSRRFLAGLDTERELQALLAGLSGRYIAPSPAGEPARRPDVLPTGRNIHALDPQKIPSPVARKAGKEMAEALLQRFHAEKGRYPETVAMVLWGTDNIKTEGEGLAQALHLMGVEVEEDSRGRANRLRLIPLEELGRPRIDVVMTVSGIFRDIFPSALELLDEAARLAAAADESPEHNFLRKHAETFSRRLQIDRDAAAARVFSNKPGEYGTGVNVMVDGSQWETTEELGHVFLERKGYAFGVEDRGEDRRDVFAACLATAEVTFQNIDSTEISLADVDHYFEYLGGVTAAVQEASGSAENARAYVADRLRGTGRVRSLEEALQVESRTRLLNPAWYEPMLAHGYQGVHEVATRLDNTFGWSATADAVGEWTYSQAADTFILDDELRSRLASLNPRATYRLAGRLLEAAERGYWEPDDRQSEGLRKAFLELENEVELNPTA